MLSVKQELLGRLVAELEQLSPGAGARAARVVRALEKSGVDAKRLAAVSRGAEQPVTSDDTPEGRAQLIKVQNMMLKNIANVVKITRLEIEFFESMSGKKPPTKANNVYIKIMRIPTFLALLFALLPTLNAHAQDVNIDQTPQPGNTGAHAFAFIDPATDAQIGDHIVLDVKVDGGKDNLGNFQGTMIRVRIPFATWVEIEANAVSDPAAGSGTG